MSTIAWVFLAMVFGVAAGSVVLVFLHHELLIKLRNRVTLWRWTEMSERTRLEPDSLTKSDSQRLKDLQDDLQRYKLYHGDTRRREMLQRITALRVLAYGPNPSSRYEAIQELAEMIVSLSNELVTETVPGELPYRHIGEAVLAQLYPNVPEPRPRGWQFESLQANPPSQKQLVELLAAVVFCMNANIERHVPSLTGPARVANH